eukprot:NODE_47_length_27404_cov_0.284270.p12 type:complete len:121 gc:universal NODE_47_length_27404_cov_0.284270:27295-26933(-)
MFTVVQACMALACAAKQASLNASLNVGCAWHVLAISSLLAPYSTAITPSAIISPAFAPMICAPNSLSLFASVSTLTNPSVSSTVLALEFAINGNCPFLYSIFFSFSSFSLYPTHATSGYV